MKVWPPGKLERAAGTSGPGPEDWVVEGEKALVETRFAGDARRFRAWRDRLWTEIDDALSGTAVEAADEEYVVMTAFEGDWAQYRVSRDRLREELWQIMKVTRSQGQVSRAG